MKKFIYSLAAVMMLATSVFTFSSCSDDEENFTYFTIGVEGNSYEGSDDAVVEAYTEAVEYAYLNALGMSGGKNYIEFNSGDLKTRSSEMKSRFDSAILPTEPTISGSYSFTFVLRGTDNATDLSDMQIIASKTFLNIKK